MIEFETYYKRISSEKEALKALSLNKYSIEYIPNIFITEKVMKNLLKIDSTLIAYLEVSIISKYLYLIKEYLIKQPLLLQFIPQELLTYELCLIAAERNGIILNYIPYKFITNELLIKALKSNISCYKVIPVDKFDKNIALILINHVGYLIEIIPDYLKTAELCDLALKNNCLLKCIPQRFRTYTRCKKLVKKDISNLHWVTDKIIFDRIVKELNISIKEF